VNYGRNKKGARFFETQCSIIQHCLGTFPLFRRNNVRSLSKECSMLNGGTLEQKIFPTLSRYEARHYRKLENVLTK